jgi:phosphatidylglycerophosphatase A
MTGRAWMALATLGPVGRIRPAPGSWGSAAAVIMAAALVQFGGWTLEVATLIICVLGTRAADIYDREMRLRVSGSRFWSCRSTGAGGLPDLSPSDCSTF